MGKKAALTVAFTMGKEPVVITADTSAYLITYHDNIKTEISEESTATPRSAKNNTVNQFRHMHGWAGQEQN